eukprot:1582180-Pyramimonas_sp.AAC.1
MPVIPIWLRDTRRSHLQAGGSKAAAWKRPAAAIRAGLGDAANAAGPDEGKAADSEPSPKKPRSEAPKTPKCTVDPCKSP